MSYPAWVVGSPVVSALHAVGNDDAARAAELVADWLPVLLKFARREWVPTSEEVIELYTDATEVLTRLQRVAPASVGPALSKALDEINADSLRIVWDAPIGGDPS